MVSDLNARNSGVFSLLTPMATVLSFCHTQSTNGKQDEILQQLSNNQIETVRDFLDNRTQIRNIDEQIVKDLYSFITHHYEHASAPETILSTIKKYVEENCNEIKNGDEHQELASTIMPFKGRENDINNALEKCISILESQDMDKSTRKILNLLGKVSIYLR
jgi:hypothetical protein